MPVPAEQLGQPRIGQRLGALRSARNLSVESLSALARLSPETLQSIEDGRLVPSANHLVALAKALGMSVYEAVTGSDDSGMIKTRYRAQSGATPRDEERAVDVVLAATKVISDLRVLRGAAPPEDIRLVSTGSAEEQGRWAAQKERARLGLGEGPIAGLKSKLHSIGFIVAEQQFPPSISGMLLARPGGTFILVQADEPATRRRFSIAHEYGHSVLDWDEDIVVSRIGDQGPRERRAEAFASNFLMPADSVRQRIREMLVRDGRPLDFTHVAQLAVAFGISYAAALFGLDRAMPMPPDQRATLWGKEDQANGYINSRLDIRRAPYSPPLLLQMAGATIAAAYRDQVVSYGKAVELATSLGMTALPALEAFRDDEDGE